MTQLNHDKTIYPSLPYQWLLRLLVPDALHLPLDDDLAKVDGEPLLLDCRRRREPQSLDGGHDVLNEVVPHWVVHLQVNHSISN